MRWPPFLMPSIALSLAFLLSIASIGLPALPIVSFFDDCYNSGEGLLFYGNVTIPFIDRFPKGEIYNLLTTRPEDMKNETKTE